ncbi:hypothetical protein ASPSYDRAFT_58955 [Aspergillus sydowii CBS 593.65]|uniref:Aminotransferase class I/classII large domain-containing protein n=1 Tax=Aspergillus sydowii CBS 593.65 TaxID=1036612 RepID=A0A1L9TDD9_9EURO|nr:uncharacterized protein ASPSYDRAFT_58955 [Aspergillus sydowii CBS 593.65]OJJ57415.1 hypothetical protein ASPSYDRAFT_58955 [Aspergillus sydowii CBS 593.65]
MVQPENSPSDTISARGRSLEPKVPVFFDVLNNLWDPELNPDGIVNLGLAENALMQTEMKQFINSQPPVESHALTYGDGFSGSKKLKASVCHFLNRHFRPFTPLLPEHLCITSGASNALENCGWGLCDPGDYILVGRPYWTTFRTIFGNRAGVNIHDVSLQGIDPMGLEAVDRFEAAFIQVKNEGKRIKAILLCSPNNPLGRCYSEDVLKAYMNLCQKLDLHLISDELYGISIWDNPEMKHPTPFTSVIAINTENLIDPRRVHAVWGLSKDFGATGLRIGVLISQANKNFLNACESISLMNFPSSVADTIVASLLSNDSFLDTFISEYRSRLSRSYQHVTSFLQEHGIPYEQSNAALFVWMRLGNVIKGQDDETILRRLRAEKVYLTSGATSAAEESGWFRIVMAHPREVLDEGLKRILGVISNT